MTVDIENMATMFMDTIMIEAVARDNLSIDIEDFDRSDNTEILMMALDSMIDDYDEYEDEDDYDSGMRDYMEDEDEEDD